MGSRLGSQVGHAWAGAGKGLWGWDQNYTLGRAGFLAVYGVGFGMEDSWVWGQIRIEDGVVAEGRDRARIGG